MKGLTKLPSALERFAQSLLDHPGNRVALASIGSGQPLAEELWRGLLLLVFRTQFIMHLDGDIGADDFPDPEFSALWKQEVSPTLDRLAASPPGHGRLSIESSLKAVFGFCKNGEPGRPALGGGLFAPDPPLLIDQLRWDEQRIWELLEVLGLGRSTAEPVADDRGPLMSRTLESLMTLAPGIAAEGSVRIRWKDYEAIVPAASASSEELPKWTGRVATKVEEIPGGSFTLCGGMGRKSTGSFYTPPPLVRFLVRRTLTPLVRRVSPPQTPDPAAILEIKILDPAMGTGNFLLEACRYLGHELRAACLRCEELASREEEEAETWYRRIPETLRRDLETLPRLDSEAKSLVAERCLYGLDLNPMAVIVAQAELWLECGAARRPISLVGNHLLRGDALTGPLTEDLTNLPCSGEPLSDELRSDLAHALGAAGLGSEGKELGKSKGDPAVLEQLRTLAGAWSSALAAQNGSGDQIYLGLVESLGDHRHPSNDPSGALAIHHEAGEQLDLGLFESLGDRKHPSNDPMGGDTEAMIARGALAICPDLAFPEVFGRGRSPGFDAVLGNPPWDKQIPLEREFYARYDATVLAAPTARERKPRYASLRQRKDLQSAWREYEAPFRHLSRVVERIYPWQRANIDKGDDHRRQRGHADAYRYFFERSWRCLAPLGRLGMILPHSFLANEGATGIRRLAFLNSHTEVCVSLRNRQKVFDIGRGQRFVLIVLDKSVRGAPLKVAFGIEDPLDVENGAWEQEAIVVDTTLIERISPTHLCLPELRGAPDLRAIEAMIGSSGESFGDFSKRRGLVVGQEMNMTTDSPLFARTERVLAAEGIPTGDPRIEPIRSTLLDAGWLLVHEKGTFNIYDDLLKDAPRYLFNRRSFLPESERRLRGRQRDHQAHEAARYERLAIRATIHASEVRKSVCCLLPAGVVVGNSALTERRPMDRPSALALVALAVMNTCCFDFLARLRMVTNLNQFILRDLPWPDLDASAEAFLAHAALRLSCNHGGYRELWIELMGDAWHEGGEPYTWPVVAGDERRRDLGVAVEAVVARAYGLTGTQIDHIVKTGDPGRISGEPSGVADAFAEISQVGCRQFAQDHDPYHEVPLPDGPPRPRLSERLLRISDDDR
jgi:hypothetical protein